MKSTANFKGHPLHPILVAFPIAFFTGAFIFDLLSIISSSEIYFTVSYYILIAGLIGALVAAIPGVIDYFTVVPPASSAKARATKHAFLNISNLAIFFAAWLLRKNDADKLFIVALEAIGIILLSVAGWLGGTLVYRNQIGVDHRYAGAGKWKDEFKKASGGIIEVASVDELNTNQMKLIHAEEKRIVIGKTEKGYVAFDDHCTHRGGTLADGVMICGTVQCPWHGSQFDVNTGEVKAGPAKEKIAVYLIEEKDGKIYLKL